MIATRCGSDRRSRLTRWSRVHSRVETVSRSSYWLVNTEGKGAALREYRGRSGFGYELQRYVESDRRG